MVKGAGRIPFSDVKTDKENNILREVNIQRRIVQEDSLSPLLFIVALIPLTSAIYGVAPSYICNLIQIKKRTRYNLRSSKELLLEPPFVKAKKTVRDKSKSFQVAAPRVHYPLE